MFWPCRLRRCSRLHEFSGDLSRDVAEVREIFKRAAQIFKLIGKLYQDRAKVFGFVMEYTVFQLRLHLFVPCEKSFSR